MSDYHIFPVSEQQKLDLMSSDQRRMYAIQDRINADNEFITRLGVILARASRERGAVDAIQPMVFAR